MIAQHAVAASRIRQELADIERVVARVEPAIAAAQAHPADQDLYLLASRKVFAYHPARIAFRGSACRHCNSRITCC